MAFVHGKAPGNQARKPDKTKKHKIHSKRQFSSQESEMEASREARLRKRKEQEMVGKPKKQRCK